MKQIMQLWHKVRQQNLMIHTISNIVTANDCANLLLAVGARPIMAQAPQEAAEITAACAATVLNLGTPDDEKMIACMNAGKEANRLKHPLVVDPVGIGASLYRKNQIGKLLTEIRPDILRANLQEIQTLSHTAHDNWGVDSPTDLLQEGHKLAKRLAKEMKCVVLLSGKEDFITNGTDEIVVSGGQAFMQKITGAGCMLSVLCGALAVVTDPLTAAHIAAVSWKTCATRAAQRIGKFGGLGTLHMALIDEMYCLTQQEEKDVNI